jgi:hypothetical protein
MVPGRVGAVAVQVRDRQRAAAVHLHRGVVREERHRQRGRVRGDAWTLVDGDGVQVDTLAGRARVAAGLVARELRVAVVPAPVALQQVPAEGGTRADLWCRHRRGHGGQRGIGRAEPFVVGDRGDRRRRADTGATVGAPGDPAQRRDAAQVHEWSGAPGAQAAGGDVGAAGPQFAAGRGEGRDDLVYCGHTAHR